MLAPKSPEWIPFEVAKWVAGTAEFDAATEFVFFRLVMQCYLEGRSELIASDRMLAMRCKTDLNVFRGAVELLEEFGKVERIDGGLIVPSTAARLADAIGRISNRQRGAAISRLTKRLKAEGLSKAEIEAAIRGEFPDYQSGDQTDNTNKQTNKQTNRQTDKGGVGGGLFEDNSGEAVDPVRQVVDEWNVFADVHKLARVQNIHDKRRRSIMARLAECGGVDGFKIALAKVAASDFLLGKKGEWKADFDFVIRASSFTKIMEGGFDRGSASGGSSSTIDALRKV